MLLKYVVEQQMEGLINTEMGRKYVSAATAVFGVGGAENLLSAFSKGAWQRLVRESKEVAMDLEMTEMCGAKPTGVEYLTYRQNGHGQAYWLGRGVRRVWCCGVSRRHDTSNLAMTNSSKYMQVRFRSGDVVPPLK